MKRIHGFSRLLRLEVYEWASLFMLIALLITYISFSTKIHKVVGWGNGTDFLWENIRSLFLHFNTWEYLILGSLFFIFIFATRHKTDPIARELHRFARVALSFLCVLVVFDTINFYIAVFNPYDHDDLLRSLDTSLFGATPSVWFDGITCFPLTLLFSGAYASWFFMTYFSVFVFARQSEAAMHQYVSAAVLTFYVGYATYFFVPAIGPEFTVHYRHSIGPILNLVDGMGPYLCRDCFPSLHTGLSVIMMIYAWRFARHLFWLYALDCSLIIISTMYLRVHYGVDLLAGAALALAVSQISPALMAHRWAFSSKSIRRASLRQATESITEPA